MIVGRRALLGLLGTAALALGPARARAASGGPFPGPRARLNACAAALPSPRSRRAGTAPKGRKKPARACAWLVLPPASSRAIAGTGARSPSPPPPPSSRARRGGRTGLGRTTGRAPWPLLPRASASRWHPQWRGLTLLHLLSHRSGFARLDNDPEMDAFPPEEADPRASRLALTGLTLARPPEAAPVPASSIPTATTSWPPPCSKRPPGARGKT
jgi:hypothetical protein